MKRKRRLLCDAIVLKKVGDVLFNCASFKVYHGMTVNNE
jgi:hypothetical protein